MMETLRPLLARSALQGSTGTSRVLKAGVASIKLLEYRDARFLVAPLFHARTPYACPCHHRDVVGAISPTDCVKCPAGTYSTVPGANALSLCSTLWDLMGRVGC